MSLFGGSKSSTSSTNLTEIHNVGASDGSIVASENSVVNVLDAGAIGEAFDFSSETYESALKFASDSLGLVQSTVSAAQRSAETTLATALGAKDEAQSGGADRLLKFGALAVAALVAVMYFSRG